jgi:hypothetical protein
MFTSGIASKFYALTVAVIGVLRSTILTSSLSASVLCTIMHVKSSEYAIILYDKELMVCYTFVKALEFPTLVLRPVLNESGL